MPRIPKYLTKAIERKLPPLYATNGLPEDKRKVWTKYFLPGTRWTWYALEYDPRDRLFFGLVISDMVPKGELGYFSLDELMQSVRVPMRIRMMDTGEVIERKVPMRVERDIYWAPVSLAEVRRRIKAEGIAGARAGQGRILHPPKGPHKVVGLISGREVEVSSVPLGPTTKEVNRWIPGTMGFKVFWVLFAPPNWPRTIIEFMAGRQVYKRDLDIINASHPVQAWTSFIWAPKEYRVNGKVMKVSRTVELGDPKWFARWMKALA